MIRTKQRRRLGGFVILAVCLALAACSSGATTSTTTDSSPRSTPKTCPKALVQLPQSTQSPASHRSPILTAVPAWVVLCRYGGLPGLGLIKSVTVGSRATLATLFTEVDALVPLSPGDVYPCPLDNGARIDTFVQSDSGTLELRFNVSGCHFITGSNAARYGFSDASARLAAEVTRLTT